MDDLNSISKAERISALMDGESSAQECVQLLGEPVTDTHLIETWHVYQVVGDVLRSPELAPTRSEMAFLEKLEQRLLQEPKMALFAPDADLASTVIGVRSIAVDISKPGANSPVFRWKVLAGVAGAVWVAVVGSSLWTQGDFSRSQEIAQVKAVLPDVPDFVATETAAGPMLRDPRLDELMAAHRQLGGHSALQVPAGFLRNATFEGVGR